MKRTLIQGGAPNQSKRLEVRTVDLIGMTGRAWFVRQLGQKLSGVAQPAIGRGSA